MTDQRLLTDVMALMQQVGSDQLRAFRSLPPGGGTEKEVREFVSTVDIRSEQHLIEGLQQLLPEAGIYGEETGTSGAEQLRWVIDPLDGTTNFLSGLDQFAISVALEEQGQAVLGAVLRPASAEWFAACRGAGLRHNNDNCPRVTDLPLRQALLGTGFPYRSEDLKGAFFPCAEEVLYRSRGLRRFGSAALDLCYVARGFLQGFWESDLQPYDVAAARLFLAETGCLATNQRGEPYSPYRDRILVCGSPAVHRELLEIVARHYPTDS